jgi:hypothetical protein
MKYSDHLSELREHIFVINQFLRKISVKLMARMQSFPLATHKPRILNRFHIKGLLCYPPKTLYLSGIQTRSVRS